MSSPELQKQVGLAPLQCHDLTGVWHGAQLKCLDSPGPILADELCSRLTSCRTCARSCKRMLRPSGKASAAYPSTWSALRVKVPRKSCQALSPSTPCLLSLQRPQQPADRLVGEQISLSLHPKLHAVRPVSPIANELPGLTSLPKPPSVEQPPETPLSIASLIDKVVVFSRG